VPKEEPRFSKSKKTAKKTKGKKKVEEKDGENNLRGRRWARNPSAETKGKKNTEKKLEKSPNTLEVGEGEKDVKSDANPPKDHTEATAAWGEKPQRIKPKWVTGGTREKKSLATERGPKKGPGLREEE